MYLPHRGGLSGSRSNQEVIHGISHHRLLIQWQGIHFLRICVSHLGYSYRGWVSISTGISHLSYLRSKYLHNVIAHRISLQIRGTMKFQRHYFAFAEVVFSEKSFQPHLIALAPMVAHLQEVLSSPPHCFCSDGTTRPNNNPLITSHQDKF